jgi:hypothetical protein
MTRAEEIELSESEMASGSGISPKWVGREVVLRWAREAQPWQSQVGNYVAGSDPDNIANVPPMDFEPIGSGRRLAAIALAMNCGEWEPELAGAVVYKLLAHRLAYFNHDLFRVRFPEHRQPLRQVSWEQMAETMVYACLLGWQAPAAYEGYLAHAVLNRGFQVQNSYEQKHRRGHALVLQLFADDKGDCSHKWPDFANDEPVYQAILGNWRNESDTDLVPALLAACDRHTWQSTRDSGKSYFDFSSEPRTPYEILFVLKLRELRGLSVPILDHPLMAKPFDHLPKEQPTFDPDDSMMGTLERVRRDWPAFEEVTSLEAVRAWARGA